MLGIQGRPFLQRTNGVLVFIEEDGAMATLEPVQSLLRGFPRVGWDDRLDLFLRDVPDTVAETSVLLFALHDRKKTYRWWFLPKTRTARVV